MQCLPPGTRLSDHLQPVVCAVYLNDIPLCHENLARVPRPSLPRAGDAIHPALGKGVVWFTRLGCTLYFAVLQCASRVRAARDRIATPTLRHPSCT